MTVESGTFISDLNANYPASGDGKSEGDNHIRWLKSAILATWPNVSGAVTPTHTELNYVDGVTSAIQTQLDSKGAIAGQTWTGPHVFPETTTGVTAAIGSNNTKFATTAYVDNTAMSSVLPTQTGYDGNVMSTEGGIASWSSLVDLPLFWMGIS